MEDKERASSREQLKNMFTDVVDAAIAMKRPPDGITGMGIEYLLCRYDRIKKDENIRVKEEIKQMVIEDVPHRYQDNLLSYCGGEEA